VTLRATTIREDLIHLARFENDLGFVFVGGGDPPEPVPLERLQQDLEREASHPPPDKVEFAMEANGSYIGRCGPYNIDRTAHPADLGIGICDKSSGGVATGARR
jgi:RimJ/RimL family protein N-acetyltransferase